MGLLLDLQKQEMSWRMHTFQTSAAAERIRRQENGRVQLQGLTDGAGGGGERKDGGGRKEGGWRV